MYPRTVQGMISFYKTSDVFHRNGTKRQNRDCRRMVIRQYRDMARGGNGGLITSDLCVWPERPLDLGYWENIPEGVIVSIRDYHYPGHPTSFFQKVCDGMGWSY